MANYYCLMAGAPDLSMEDGGSAKAAFDSFREQCDEVLTDKDRTLLFNFYLKQDCLNLVKLLKDPQADVLLTGNYTMEQYTDLITSAQSMNFNVHRYPAFMSIFAREYPYNKDKVGYFAEDQMMLAYYEYAMTCPNKTISSWYQLNFDITNILTAFIARKMGWNVSDYIMGEGEVNEMIRMNNTKDFDLSNEFDYVKDLMKIVDVEDPVEKERQIDAFKWNWLDEAVFMNVFGIEAVFAYLCKLEMMMRWSLLDPVQGKETFRQIIENLRGEAKVPEEFMINNINNKTIR